MPPFREKTYARSHAKPKKSSSRKRRTKRSAY